jgi:hypothetical protein
VRIYIVSVFFEYVTNKLEGQAGGRRRRTVGTVLVIFFLILWVD